MTEVPVGMADGSVPQIQPDVAPDVDDADAAGWDFESAPAHHALRPWQRPPMPGVIYAELPLRAIAYLVDLVLVAFVVSVVAHPLVGIAEAAVIPHLDITNDMGLRAVLIEVGPPAVVFLAALVAIVYCWTTFRASPGQMTLGLFTVTRIDGLALTRRQALLRSLLLYGPMVFLWDFAGIAVRLGQLATNFGTATDALPTILVYVLLEIGPLVWIALLTLSIARDRRGRGWHDKLAGSVVVRREGPPS